jgi:hypothetical protein
MVFDRLWPAAIARALSSIYELSYRSNKASHVEPVAVGGG